ncbi:asparagine synthase (glutamine-hydrolysing) [Paenibacillus castaneae]|uniref:asparagine synthase (glutamine-hydrolyzing) n=1 Tax=Paenibacillus castaneae TaxID=474957 RepID=UPI000C9BCC82|nr:asparagine synthase (glutamine-hydrolyzing) [Paenibacillus castaneae]NIK79838.1 asparagine synthase (glutamine-hydrolysing) [Paenibacillus castaneae]
MCGFVGFANSRLDVDQVSIIKAMMDTIVHRGPDSGGIYSDEVVTLGFRRLKIIDMSEEASQPMYNEDKSCVLVFNGEIYNYQELRQELLEKGHTFVSHTDSEVIIHAYEEYGVGVLQKLRGMFAFAIWDTNKESLFLARDFFGIKPLYYTQNTLDGSFLFGSEIKAFLQQPSFRKELNKDALKPYLTFQYSVLDETFFKGVYKLKPGHYMLYEHGKLEINSYWDAAFAAEENSLAYYVDQIKSTVKESVDYHAISDVKVGSFLSGGIDSSYITALLKPNKTFSVGFQDYEGNFNETNLAKELSDILGIENHKKLVTADECFELLPTIQYHMDEPQSNPSSVPLYFLAELASQHVTVVLSGEGADEIFGGYDWYDTTPAMKKYKKLPFVIRRSLSLVTGKLPKNRITSFVVKGGQRVEERFIGQAKVFDEADALALLKDEYKSSPSSRSITKDVYDKVRGKDDITKMQYVDLKLWLPGDILLKADKMSLAHSIELRVPFLDKMVMELAAKLPTPLRVHDNNTKYALRTAAKEVLPDEWANRPKVGFPVPIRHWLREEKYYLLVKSSFQSQAAEQFFHTEQLTHYLDAHYSGKQNYARYIWTVYVFLVWHKRFFE